MRFLFLLIVLICIILGLSCCIKSNNKIIENNEFPDIILEMPDINQGNSSLDITIELNNPGFRPKGWQTNCSKIK